MCARCVRAVVSVIRKPVGGDLQAPARQNFQRQRRLGAREAELVAQVIAADGDITLGITDEQDGRRLVEPRPRRLRTQGDDQHAQRPAPRDARQANAAARRSPAMGGGVDTTGDRLVQRAGLFGFPGLHDAAGDVEAGALGEDRFSRAVGEADPTGVVDQQHAVPQPVEHFSGAVVPIFERRQPQLQLHSPLHVRDEQGEQLDLGPRERFLARTETTVETGPSTRRLVPISESSRCGRYHSLKKSVRRHPPGAKNISGRITWPTGTTLLRCHTVLRLAQCSMKLVDSRGRCGA